MQTHNAILVAWSVYMSFGILFECIPKGYKLWGNPFNPAHVGVAHYFYHFYISKFYEFMDTYIMLYRWEEMPAALPSAPVTIDSE